MASRACASLTRPRSRLVLRAAQRNPLIRVVAANDPGTSPDYMEYMFRVRLCVRPLARAGWFPHAAGARWASMTPRTAPSRATCARRATVCTSTGSVCRCAAGGRARALA